MISTLKEKLTPHTMMNVLHQQSKLHHDKSHHLRRLISSHIQEKKRKVRSIAQSRTTSTSNHYSRDIIIGYEALDYINFSSSTIMRAATEEERYSVKKKKWNRNGVITRS